jgi:hypothetical protein
MNSVWRRRFEIEPGSAGFWQVGPLKLWARRERHEWLLSLARGDDALEDALVVALGSDVPQQDDTVTNRFGFRDPPSFIRLAPAPAPRPVVVTPQEPFHLPPRQGTTLYVSTPVWVSIEVGEPPIALLEEPSQRPSDSWFGPSTRVGELCYAVRVPATLELDAAPIRPHRAMSVVHINNSASTTLEVARIKLPNPNMSLFLAADGNLWTEAVTLNHQQEGELAEVELSSGAPNAASGAERLAAPRKRLDKGLLDRAFGGLIRDLRG